MSLKRYIHRMFWYPSESDEVTSIPKRALPKAAGDVPRPPVPSGLLVTKRRPPISSTRWDYKGAD